MESPSPVGDPIKPLTMVMSDLWADLPGLLTDRVRLFALELRRATTALGQMVALGLLAAVLTATAWLALWGGLAAALMALGIAWGWAVLLILCVNIGGAIWCGLRIKALAPVLTLPATLRRLTDSDSEERHDAEKERSPPGNRGTYSQQEP